MGRNDEVIKKFSSHLFWDVKREELDSEKDKAFIIKRALEYGLSAMVRVPRTTINN